MLSDWLIVFSGKDLKHSLPLALLCQYKEVSSLLITKTDKFGSCKAGTVSKNKNWFSTQTSTHILTRNWFLQVQSNVRVDCYVMFM